MKKLKRLFIHYFVPHKRNKYKPHFLRIEVAGAVALVIVLLFLGAYVQEKLLVTNGQAAAVVASSLVDLANVDRAGSDLPPLTENAKLQQAAQLKANDMVANGYFAHTSPSGRDPWYWFQQAGYNFSYAGENLAVYFSDSNDVNTAWMNSPEHRANILDPDYTQIGIAVANGLYQGVETTFVVQEFGAPAALAAAPASAPVAKPVAATTPAPVSVAPATTPKPEVAGAESPQPKVNVIAQDESGIAVRNQNAAPAQQTTPSTPPAPVNPIEAFFLKFITSPQTNLRFAYEFIGAIVALALILEIGVEMRRQHPHRIVIGLSLIALMVVLVYADHAFFVGNLLIV